MEFAAAALYGLFFAFGGEEVLYPAVIISVVLIIVFIYFMKGMSKTDGLKELVLSSRLTHDKGYTSAEDREYLLGRQGEVLYELRPSGTVIIDKNPVDVVSEGGFIKKGETVEVVSVNGNRVVVRKVEKI